MRATVLWLAIAVEGGLVLVALGLGWLLNSPPFARLSLAWPAVGLGVAGTLVPLAGFWWCARSRRAPLRRLMVEVERIVEAFSEISCGEIALISLLAGMGEEGFFRGVIQSALAGWINPWAAVFGASGLFGLAHLITPTYALLAGFFGLYLGALLFASGNLAVPIIVHALYDFVALVYLLRKRRLRETARSA